MGKSETSESFVLGRNGLVKKPEKVEQVSYTVLPNGKKKLSKAERKRRTRENRPR